MPPLQHHFGLEQMPLTACASMVATSCKNTQHHNIQKPHDTELPWFTEFEFIRFNWGQGFCCGSRQDSFPFAFQWTRFSTDWKFGWPGSVTESMVDVLSQIDSKHLGKCYPSLPPSPACPNETGRLHPLSAKRPATNAKTWVFKGCKASRITSSHKVQ